MSVENRHNKTAMEWDEHSSSFAVYAARRHVPLAGTFELTPRCNLNCKMCYIRLSPKQLNGLGRELTAGEWIALGKDAVKAGTLNLLLTGGEPLLRDDFPEIYTELCKMGFIITLNTNAALMSESYRKLFSKYPPTSVAVTLYGSSPETYEKICGNGAGFEQTVRGLEVFAGLPVNLEVRTTFIKDNMRELDEIRAIANRYTSRYAINVFVTKAVRGAVSCAQECRMTPAQSADVDGANFLHYHDLSHHQEAKESIEEHGEHIHDDGPDAVKDDGRDIPPLSIPCMAAKSSYWISWDGKMLPCGNFTSPYTLPLESGFAAAWDRLPALLEDVAPPEKCMACELKDNCPGCPANLQAETGVFDEPVPYFCEYAKAHMNWQKKMGL